MILLGGGVCECECCCLFRYCSRCFGLAFGFGLVSVCIVYLFVVGFRGMIVIPPPPPPPCVEGPSLQQILLLLPPHPTPPLSPIRPPEGLAKGNGQGRKPPPLPGRKKAYNKAIDEMLVLFKRPWSVIVRLCLTGKGDTGTR